MYSGAGARAGSMASTRAPDLLQQIQKEFESVAHTTQMYKAERDDIERKCEHKITIHMSVEDVLGLFLAKCQCLHAATVNSSPKCKM